MERKSGKTPRQYRWIEPGMRVLVMWSYDRVFGPGSAEFAGVVKQVDDWIWVVSNSKTHLHMPLDACDAVAER